MSAPWTIGSANGVRPTPSAPTAETAARSMGYPEMGVWVLVAAISFHVAYAGAVGSFLSLLYLFALAQLARSNTWRQRCYSGLAVGLFVAVFRLAFL